MPRKSRKKKKKRVVSVGIKKFTRRFNGEEFKYVCSFSNRSIAEQYAHGWDPRRWKYRITKTKGVHYPYHIYVREKRKK